MLKTLLILLLCLTRAALAQTNCAQPVIRLLHDTQKIPTTGSALPPAVLLQIVPAVGCPAQQYRFRHAQITLLRRGRPVVPSKLLEDSVLDLRPLLTIYQPGDQLHIFIAYQDLALVAADGTLLPLAPTGPVSRRFGQLDLQTDESKGISLRWVLRKP